MQSKKAKVTKVTKLDKKDNYGNSTSVVEFENGDKGYYTHKDENQTKFITGREADYVIEEKQGSKGPYFKVTLPQSQQQQRGGFGGKPAIDPRTQMISFAAAYTKDLVVADKVKLENFETQFNKIYSVMTSKL